MIEYRSLVGIVFPLNCEQLFYSYDANGNLYSVKYTLIDTSDLMVYYYTHNSRGDTVGIYNGLGELRAHYEYDTWGNVLSVTDQNGNAITNQNHIGNLNPFRYRGYYYDTETGLYYVSSHYYDSIIGRWINADSVIPGASGSVQGYNLFAYCFNNPVNMSDETGHWPKWIKDAAKWVNNNIFKPVARFFSPKTNTISGQFKNGIVKGSGSLTGGYSEFNG